MNLVILDLEWNGSFSKKVRHYVNEIIEFGAIKTDESFHVIDTFSMLIKPQIGKKLSSHIASLTHISNDELFDDGEDFLGVSAKFAEFSKDSVILTWGTSDLLTLMDNFSYFKGESRIPFLKKYCNLQEYCEKVLNLYNPAAQLGLATCAEHLGISSSEDELHWALADSRLSLECLRRTYNSEKFRDFVYYADDAFYRKITFKNKLITDLNNPLVDRSKMFFLCEDCGIKAEQLTRFKVKNKSFTAKFRCPKCRNIFNGRISIRLRYDGVTMKKRTFINEPPKLDE